MTVFLCPPPLHELTATAVANALVRIVVQKLKLASSPAMSTGLEICQAIALPADRQAFACEKAGATAGARPLTLGLK